MGGSDRLRLLLVLASSRPAKDYLSIRPYILEQPRNTAQVLIKMVALLQWTGNGLQDLLILLSVRFMHLLCLGDVVLQIATSMLVGLQPFEKQAGGL